MGLKIKRIKIAFTSVGLCMAVLLGTAAQGIIGGSALRSKSPKTLLKNISGLSGETEYAHGIKTDSDGNFVFSYGEKSYKNEWERLMAEKAFRQTELGRYCLIPYTKQKKICLGKAHRNVLLMQDPGLV